MIRSLRWRLQAWHAVVLTMVLSIFGVVVYHLLWTTRADDRGRNFRKSQHPGERKLPHRDVEPRSDRSQVLN